MTFTSWLTNVAELLGMSRQIAAGLDLIADASAQIELTGERFWEAEVWRVRGDLLLLREQQGNNSWEAETCYRKAIEIAQARNAKSKFGSTLIGNGQIPSRSSTQKPETRNQRPRTIHT